MTTVRAKSKIGRTLAMLTTVEAFDRIGEENAFAVLARATELAPPGARHHQPRHRPAGLPDAASHRRGGRQGFARRPPWLHARDGHPAAARGGRGRPAQAPRRRGVARPGDDRAGRQGDHVHGHPDVRRARRRDPLSGPRLPDLSVDDRVHRRHAGAGADPRGERLRLLGRRDAGADHAEDAASHHQLARQPDRRRDAEGRDRRAGGRPRTSPARGAHVGRDLRADDL